MSKTYNYKNLSFPVADNNDVNLKIVDISNGNSSHTVINKPGEDDPEIQGPGTVFIDKGKNLRAETTYIVTALDNFIPQADTIKVEYYINNTLILTHTNPKTETESPIIILHLKFPTA